MPATAVGDLPQRRPHSGPLLATLLLLAGVLRIPGMFSFPFDQDELYTIIEGSRLFHSPLHPGIQARPLYFLLQHVLLTIAPPTAPWLRLLPVLFGLLGVWATWAVARRLVGPVGAAAAAFLVAISPWHLYASDFARYYALLYLLAILAIGELLEGTRDDRPSRYWRAALLLVLGTLTHPTFCFPFVGVALGLSLSTSTGRYGWRWPSRRAWTFLWLPFLAALAIEWGVLHFTGSNAALNNFGGRGASATLRLVPALIEWMTPIVFAAALLGTVGLLADGRPDRRRLGLVVVGGIGSTLVLLLAAATRTDVYVDYGMSMLPLVFLAIGGGIQWVAERAPGVSRPLASALVGLIAAGVAPGTVSHLIDGTRFDYRPAFAAAAASDSGHLVLTWPIIQQRAYAPTLRAAELSSDTAALTATLQREGVVWVIASYHRDGLVANGGTRVEAWLDAACHEIRSFEKPRFDYRRYRVTILRCVRGSP